MIALTLNVKKKPTILKSHVKRICRRLTTIESIIILHIVLHVETSFELLKNNYFNNISLKVHQCRFENLPLCLRLYKSNALKISHSQS